MAGRTKQKFPKVPGPGKQKDNPISLLLNLVKTGMEMGLGAGAVNIAKNAYEYMEDRGFQPFRPGDDSVDKDYYDKPMTKYDHRKTDAPMTTTTGQTIYDMANRGPEGEILHKAPVTGNRTMTRYNMTPDPKETPDILKVSPEDAIKNDSMIGTRNNPDEFQFYEGEQIQTESDSNAQSVMQELKATDINTIEDFESVQKEYKRMIEY